MRHPTPSTETLRWLVTDYAFHYPAPFPGAGAPHFASPSSFDLGNRVLTGNHDLGDPLAQLAATPMDTGHRVRVVGSRDRESS